MTIVLSFHRSFARSSLSGSSAVFLCSCYNSEHHRSPESQHYYTVPPFLRHSLTLNVLLDNLVKNSPPFSPRHFHTSTVMSLKISSVVCFLFFFCVRFIRIQLHFHHYACNDTNTESEWVQLIHGRERWVRQIGIGNNAAVSCSVLIVVQVSSQQSGLSHFPPVLTPH